MKPDRLHSCNAEQLHEGYEQLRRDALGNWAIEGMKGKGLVLFLRHGMLAWILAWSECAIVDSASKNECEVSDRYLMPEDIRYQTAVLLATMAVHVRREVRSI